jgi:hypothetical protein
MLCPITGVAAYVGGRAHRMPQQADRFAIMEKQLSGRYFRDRNADGHLLEYFRQFIEADLGLAIFAGGEHKGPDGRVRELPV